MDPLFSLDQLEKWGNIMADAGHGLRIKYGLGNNPTTSQIQAWARETRVNINRGLGREQAGETAAKLLFPDFRTHHYASQADEIEALLRAAEGK
jgi:hypothetical protein